MIRSEQITRLLLEQKLLPLYYHDDAEVSMSILQALYDGGIRMVEYTNRGEAALENFRALRKMTDKKLPGLMLGIGTVKSKKQAKKYIEAGADFIVCPSMNEEVGEVVQDADLLWIPGCMTPTEIAAAENAGATIVKLFPGSLLGPSFVNAVKDLFPGIQFVVTGGVEAEVTNLREWFQSGVVAVGIGSKLITKSQVGNRDYESLKLAAERALQLVKDACG